MTGEECAGGCGQALPQWQRSEDGRQWHRGCVPAGTPVLGARPARRHRGPGRAPVTGPDHLPLPTEPVRERLRVRVNCRRCHRPLHDPEPRLLRLGPECRQPDARTARRDIDQDTLPGVE